MEQDKTRKIKELAKEKSNLRQEDVLKVINNMVKKGRRFLITALQRQQELPDPTCIKTRQSLRQLQLRVEILPPVELRKVTKQ